MSTSWKGELTDVLCYGFDPAKNELHLLAQDVARRKPREHQGSLREPTSDTYIRFRTRMNWLRS
jgi:hypothetical protein